MYTCTASHRCFMFRHHLPHSQGALHKGLEQHNRLHIQFVLYYNILAAGVKPVCFINCDEYNGVELGYNFMKGTE